MVTAENDKDVVRAGANIANVQISEARNINVYDLLKYNSLVITQDALKVVEEVFN